MDTIFHVQFPGLGLEFTVDRVALSLGGFNIYWYGVLIALGLVLGMAFAFHFAPDFGLNADRLVDVVAIGTVMGIVCARIAYVAMAPFEYDSLWQMLYIRQGGIAIYGAIIGAFLFGGLAARWRQVPLLPLFDAVGMGFLIGQGIGRWGNFVNQEAFGTNTTLPWGMTSEKVVEYINSHQAQFAANGITMDPNVPVHPTFLYESIWCILGFFVLFYICEHHRKFSGQIMLTYGVWYGLERMVVEGMRTDSLYIAGTTLRVSQVLSAVLALVCAVALVVLLRKYKKSPKPIEGVDYYFDKEGKRVEMVRKGETAPFMPNSDVKLSENSLPETEEEKDNGTDN